MNAVHVVGGRHKANKWQGRNITRWRNAEYDKPVKAAETRARSGEARGAVHQDERLVVGDHGGRSRVVYRPERRRRVSNRLHAPLSGWDNDFWQLQDWYREA